MKTFTQINEHQYLSMGLALILMALVFISDLFTPLGFAHGILYIPVLIYSLARVRTSQRFQRAMLAFSLIGTATGYVFAPNPPESLPDVYIATNRLLSAGLLMLTYAYGRKLTTINRLYLEASRLEQTQRQTLEDFIEAMPVQVWSADASGTVDFVSGSLVTFTGKSRETILKDWLALLHPDDRERTIDTWLQSVSTGVPYQIEFRIRRRDGEYIWFQTQAVAQRNEQGEVQRWLGSSIDIDDLRRFREQTERLAAQYRHTVESITDAFFTLDHHFRFTYLNQNAAEVLGSTVDALLGEVIWEKCQIGYDSIFAKRYRLSAKRQQKIHFEEYYTPGDKWLDVHVYPSPDGLTVYFSDITELRMEREQLKLLNTAVSRLNDIIIITEAASLEEPGPKTVYVNDAFEKLTGYSAQEILGKSPRLLQGPKTDRKELDKIRSALINKEPVSAQIINYTKTGKEYWLELDIVPLVDKSGECTHLVAVERDITQQKKLQAQLITAQKMESIGQLTGGISHDFNNLLTVILGNAELLRDLLKKEDRLDLTELADMVCSASEKGASLTRNLLAFAKKQPLSPTRINLSELFADMTPILKSSLGERNRLTINLEDELWPVTIDPSQLESAILNLAINAKDAMPRGGCVRIHARNYPLETAMQDQRLYLDPGRYVQMTFSDDGEGMPIDIQNRIFEPFFSTKTDANGSGLGLSMIYGFLRQSKGDITVYSEPGMGTTFHLYLPCEGDFSETDLKTESNIPHSVDPESTVLVVEDNTEIRSLAVNMLKNAGYRVVQVENGEQALRSIREGLKLDLLFSDVVMPGSISGPELAGHARDRIPNLKVILTSGFADQHSDLDLQNNCDIFLQKPYRSQELLNFVHQLLGKATPSRNPIAGQVGGH